MSKRVVVVGDMGKSGGGGVQLIFFWLESRSEEKRLLTGDKLC